MLTREIMGVLALSILWVNTLLIAASALKLAGEHRRRLRALREISLSEEGMGLLRGRVDEGDGDGALARYEVEQLGRAGSPASGRRTIHFADREITGQVLGGLVSVGETSVRVSPGKGEVWPDRAEVLAAAGCSEQERFEAAFADARRARGHARKITIEVGAGRTVWIAGELRRTESGCELGPSGDLGVLVSVIDPRAWLRRASIIATGFALLETAVAAAITALVLVPPVFDGWPSKLGGVLGLAFFLAVQPLGTMVRDLVRTPGRAFVRGRWIEPGAAHSAGRSEQQRVPVE